jgi:UDP-glucose 4-epimerase
MTASPSNIVLIPYADAYAEGFEDMPRRVPDLRKIAALVGYRATASLDDILERVIAATRTALAPAGRG